MPTPGGAGFHRSGDGPRANSTNMLAYVGMIIGIAALGLVVHLFLRLGGLLVERLGPNATGSITVSAFLDPRGGGRSPSGMGFRFSDVVSNTASHLEEEFVVTGGAVAAADDYSPNALDDHNRGLRRRPRHLVHLIGGSARLRLRRNRTAPFLRGAGNFTSVEGNRPVGVDRLVSIMCDQKWLIVPGLRG